MSRHKGNSFFLTPTSILKDHSHISQKYHNEFRSASKSSEDNQTIVSKRFRRSLAQVIVSKVVRRSCARPVFADL